MGGRQVLTVPTEELRTVGIEPTILYEWPFADRWVRIDRDTTELVELPAGAALEPLPL